ncbi:hypothetical protein RBU49_11065 [Clostridium sp. MB40-C1]|uniref:hypothetical protein n=1 Tax=Clostridium sp. MB40-C1 TaxID=3070996 RepID=UPI0027E0596F|nr:hypothetical protein [Clostridium sp. MB40-C1]WMJ79429.1 hypothetical protein RBU49_11065 [Clostridium sp. MB40-C1]
MYRSDLLDDYEMVPFELPSCIYMPREIDAVLEDQYFEDMTRGEEEVEEVDNRQKNKYDDKDDDFYDDDKYDSNIRPRDVDRICRMIERNHPEIIRTMMRYGVPYPVAIRLCRRIVRITLRYC